MNDPRFEHDGPDDNDEALAREQAERERELDEIDTAASLDASGPHEAERERLGGDLAWWAEDDGVPPLDIASEITGAACGYVAHLRKLAEYGLPLDLMPAPLVLDHLSGPLVMAGLQLLGTLHPHLREDIAEIIRYVNESTPVATPDEEEQYEAAHHQYALERMAEARQQFEQAGIPVVSIEDFFGGGSDPDEQDAGLN